jgi:hypothetical protein
MRCGCGCDGCTVGRVWYVPDEADLFPDRQWVNMSDEEQGGQGEAEGQEEREEEARAERELQEDMVLGAEGRGAPGEEREPQGPLAEGSETVLELQTAQVAAGRGQEKQTAEGKKRSDLEKAAACRNRTQEDLQARKKAAERLMADKRAREEEGESGEGRKPYEWSGAGRVKKVLSGPPGVYSLYGTREEAVGSAVNDQVAEATQALQAEQASRGLHQTGLLPPRTASVVRRLVETEGVLWRRHLEWRQKVHSAIAKLRVVTEEVISTAPVNSQTRKKARVQLKTLQRIMECEETEEARERIQREEAAQRVMRVARATGEAEEEWTAALQSRAGTAAGGRLPPQSAAEATEEAAGRESQTSAGCTPRQQIRRMLQEAEKGVADAEEHEEEPADAGSQDAEDPQGEQGADPAVQLQFDQLQQDMANAAMLEVVAVGLRELQEQMTQRSEWASQRGRAAQATADAERAAARNETGAAVFPTGTETAVAGPEDPDESDSFDSSESDSSETPPHTYSPVTLSYSSDAEQTGADAEQAAEVEQMHREIMQNTQGIASGRQQQMAVAQMTQQAEYYGPQPGQRATRVTSGGSRRQRSSLGAATEQELQSSGSSSKQVKARQNVTGVDTGGNRVAKSRRTSELSVERLELGNVLVGAALQQAERWVQQWDRLVGRSSSRHLRVSTPARSSEEKWRQGVWARQQLMSNDHTVWREAEWVELIIQQYGNLTELVPWDQQVQLEKYAKSNPEPD